MDFSFFDWRKSGRFSCEIFLDLLKRGPAQKENHSAKVLGLRTCKLQSTFSCLSIFATHWTFVTFYGLIKLLLLRPSSPFTSTVGQITFKKLQVSADQRKCASKYLGIFEILSIFWHSVLKCLSAIAYTKLLLHSLACLQKDVVLKSYFTWPDFHTSTRASLVSLKRAPVSYNYRQFLTYNGGTKSYFEQ